jgi:hypothetical protein
MRTVRMFDLRVLAPLLAILLSIGMPILRMIHEEEHHAHQARSLAAAPLPGPAISSDDDDDCGTCALCQAFSAAAALHALPGFASAMPATQAIPAMHDVPPIGSCWTPGLSRQPPARGPPRTAS